MVDIYVSGNKYIYLKNRPFCSQFVPVVFLRKLTMVLKVPAHCSPPCFCSLMLVVVRARVGSPTLQSWSLCLDFQQSSQAMLLSACPPTLTARHTEI